jgi:hypothetical protein
MSEPRNIPWTTISVEAVAVVMSILLAFAIDAWWTERKESEVEHVALLALRDDFMASREQLVAVLQSLEAARTNYVRFESATVAELIEHDIVTNRNILTALVKNHTFDPVTATLDALVNDGRLALISDAALLVRLSHWQQSLDNLQDISFELRAESVRVRRAMEQHGGPFSRWRQRVDAPIVLRQVDGATMVNMRRDVDFMGTTVSHQYALSIYLNSLYDLAETLDSIVTSLDQAVTDR